MNSKLFPPGYNLTEAVLLLIKGLQNPIEDTPLERFKKNRLHEKKVFQIIQLFHQEPYQIPLDHFISEFALLDGDINFPIDKDWELGGENCSLYSKIKFGDLYFITSKYLDIISASKERVIVHLNKLMIQDASGAREIKSFPLVSHSVYAPDTDSIYYVVKNKIGVFDLKTGTSKTLVTLTEISPRKLRYFEGNIYIYDFFGMLAIFNLASRHIKCFDCVSELTAMAIHPQKRILLCSFRSKDSISVYSLAGKLLDSIAVKKPGYIVVGSNFLFVNSSEKDKKFIHAIPFG